MVDRKISVGVDVQAFNSGVNAIKAGMKTLQSAVASLEKSFKGVSDASTKARQVITKNALTEKNAVARLSKQKTDFQRKELGEVAQLTAQILDAKKRARTATGLALKAQNRVIRNLQRELDKRHELARQGTNTREVQKRALDLQLADIRKTKNLQAGLAKLAANVELQQQKRVTAGLLAGEAKKRAALDKTAAKQARLARQAIAKSIGADRLKGPIGIRQGIGNQLQGLEAAARKAGVSAARVQEIFRKMQRGVSQSVTATEAKVVRSLTGIQNSLAKLARANRGAIGQILLSWKTLARVGAFQVVHALISRTTMLLREAVQAAQEFGKTTTLILTLVDDSAGGFDQWADAIKDVSNEFGGTLGDTAKAVFEAVSNQIVETTQEARLFASEIAKLARVTGDSFEDAGTTVSGLINAYQTGLSDVNTINAKLFAAVDLGRFQLSDIADQLGRAAPQANQLGISLEELLASLSVLTIEGRNANASITLIRNVTLKLLKPSEEFEKLLNKMGFATGRAAIQQLGLFGVLRKLSTEIPRSKIPELFPELRALEGITSLATNSFDTFATNFAKIGGKDAIERIESLRGELGGLGVDLEQAAEEFDPQERFARAFEITEESPFTQVEKELNKVKNLVAEGFGETVIRTFAKINKEAGGLASILSDVGTSVTDNIFTEVFGTLISLIGQATNGTAGFRNAINAITVTLKVFAETWLILQIASSKAMASAILGLKTMSANFVVATSSAKVFGAQMTFIGKQIGKFLTSPAILVGAIVAAVEIAKAQYQDLFETQERFIEQNKRRVEEEKKDLQDLNTAALSGQKAVLGTATTEIEEFFKNRVNQAQANAKALAAAEQEFTNFIATTVKERVKKFEGFAKAVSSTVGTLNENIAKAINRIADLRIRRSFDLFETELRLSKVRDGLTERSLKAEIDLVKDAIKEIDTAISDSEKRVIDLQRSNEDTKRQFVSGLRSEQEQFNALIVQLAVAADAAQAAALAGTTDVAREQLEKAAALNSEAQAILKSQIEEARSSAEAAREAAGGSDLTGVARADLLAEANRQFSIAEQKLQSLGALEQERRDTVAEQLDIERKIQDIKATERLRVEEQLASLQRNQLTFARDEEQLTLNRIEALRDLVDGALDEGQFSRATEFIKEQERLLESISQTRIKAFQTAKENEDLETANQLLQKIKDTEQARRGLAQERIDVERQGIRHAVVAKSELETLVSVARRNLIQFKEVAKEAQAVRFFDTEGVAKDAEVIKGALTAIFDDLDRISSLPPVDLSRFSGLEALRDSIAKDLNEFGEQIDVRESVTNAIDFMQAKFTEFKGSEALSVPVRTDLEALQTSLEETAEVLKAADLAPLRIKFDFSDIELLADQVSQVLSKTQQDIAGLAGSLGDLQARQISLGPELEGQLAEARKIIVANFRLFEIEPEIVIKDGKEVKRDPSERRVNPLSGLFADISSDLFGESILEGELTATEVFDQIDKLTEQVTEAANRLGDIDADEVQKPLQKILDFFDSIRSANETDSSGVLGTGLFGRDKQGVIDSINELENLLKEQVSSAANITAQEAAQKALEDRLSIIEDLGEKLGDGNEIQRQSNILLAEENRQLATNLDLRGKIMRTLAGDDVSDIRPAGIGGGAGAGASSETNVSIETKVIVEGTAGESPGAFANRVAIAVRDVHHRGLLL